MITIALDGTSAYVAATDSSTVWQHNVNPATGMLTPKSAAAVATEKTRTTSRSRRTARTPT